MFFISSLDKQDRKWGITDTSDSIEEFYSFSDLKEFETQGVKILGFTGGYCNICYLHNNILVVPNTSNNSIDIYNKNSGKLVSKFSFDAIQNNRNDVLFSGSITIKVVNDTLNIACSVTVKYDIEFAGTCMFKVDAKTGDIIASLDEVLFICDDAKQVHDTISRTGGDCPDFITSIKANQIVKENNLQ